MDTSEKLVKSNIINLSQLSKETSSFNIGDICIRSNYDYENDACIENTCIIPSVIQQDFHRKYGSVLNSTEDFPKLVLYYFLQLDVEKIISDVDADEFICKDDIINRNKKLILIGNAIYPTEICKLLPRPTELQKQILNKSLIVFIITDVYQLVYFSKRFMEMYSEGQFNYDIEVIINYKYNHNNNDDSFYNLSKVSTDLIKKILGLPGVNISACGTNLTNLTKCFYSFLHKHNKNNYFDSYEYIVKIDTSTEKHDIREIELFNVLTKLDYRKTYTYNNHPYVCYLLNVLGVKKFPEQEFEFSKKLYEKIERTNKHRDNGDNGYASYFRIKTEIIKKYKMWVILEELNDTDLYLEKDLDLDKYMSLYEASLELFDIL